MQYFVRRKKCKIRLSNETISEGSLTQETIHFIVKMPRKYIYFLSNLMLVRAFYDDFVFLSHSPCFFFFSFTSLALNTRIYATTMATIFSTTTRECQVQTNFSNCSPRKKTQEPERKTEEKKLIKIFTTILQSEFAKVYYNRLT